SEDAVEDPGVLIRIEVLKHQIVLPEPIGHHRELPGLPVACELVGQEVGVLDEAWAAGENVFPLARGEGVVAGGTNHYPYLAGRNQLVLKCEIGIDGVAEVCLPVPDQGELGDEERLVSAHSRQNVVEERLYRVRVLDVRMNVDPLELGSLPDECHP